MSKKTDMLDLGSRVLDLGSWCEILSIGSFPDYFVPGSYLGLLTLFGGKFFFKFFSTKLAGKIPTFSNQCLVRLVPSRPRVRDGDSRSYDEYFIRVLLYCWASACAYRSHSSTLELLRQLVDGCKTLIIFILGPGLLNTKYIHEQSVRILNFAAHRLTSIYPSFYFLFFVGRISYL